MRLMTIVLLFLIAPQANATNLWQQNSATVGLDERWGGYGELQMRWVEDLSREQAMIVRLALLYRVNPEFRLGFGGGWIPQYQPVERGESRLYQQLDYTPAAWPGVDEWAASARFRLEQRYLESAHGPSYRARLKLQLNWMPGEWGAYFWNEAFFHLNSKPRLVNSGLDQNRLSVGPRAKFGWLSTELGYLLQTLKRLDRKIASDHGVVLSLGANLW